MKRINKVDYGNYDDSEMLSRHYSNGLERVEIKGKFAGFPIDAAWRREKA